MDTGCPLSQTDAATLRYCCLTKDCREETHMAAERGHATLHGNYRCTEVIVSFVSRHFYVARGSPVHASGKILHHPQH